MRSRNFWHTELAISGWIRIFNFLAWLLFSVVFILELLKMLFNSNIFSTIFIINWTGMRRKYKLLHNNQNYFFLDKYLETILRLFYLLHSFNTYKTTRYYINKCDTTFHFITFLLKQVLDFRNSLWGSVKFPNINLYFLHILVFQKHLIFLLSI